MTQVLQTNVRVEYVPLPPEKRVAWEAGIDMLIELLRKHNDDLPYPMWRREQPVEEGERK